MIPALSAFTCPKRSMSTALLMEIKLSNDAITDGYRLYNQQEHSYIPDCHSGNRTFSLFLHQMHMSDDTLVNVFLSPGNLAGFCNIDKSIDVHFSMYTKIFQIRLVRSVSRQHLAYRRYQAGDRLHPEFLLRSIWQQPDRQR